MVQVLLHQEPYIEEDEAVRAFQMKIK